MMLVFLFGSDEKEVFFGVVAVSINILFLYSETREKRTKKALQKCLGGEVEEGGGEGGGGGGGEGREEEEEEEEEEDKQKGEGGRRE